MKYVFYDDWHLRIQAQSETKAVKGENLVQFYGMAVCSLVRALTQFGWVDVSASKSAPRKSSDGHMCAITPNTVDIAVKFSGMDHFLNTRLVS